MTFTYENNDSCKVKQSTERTMQARPDAHKRVFKFESRNPLWEQTYRRIRTFECPECGYGSLKNPHSREDCEQLLGGTTVVVEPYLVPPPRCRLSSVGIFGSAIAAPLNGSEEQPISLAITPSRSVDRLLVRY